MSFYSYKKRQRGVQSGVVNGNILTNLNQRVCIQVKNVYDSCMSQEQLDDEQVVVSNIVPVLPGCDCHCGNSRSCRCTCEDNRCTCTCPSCGGMTHQEAVENAENACGPLPQPCGQWTFESCRSSTTAGTISNLCIERMCDGRSSRVCAARCRCRSTCSSPTALPGVDGPDDGLRRQGRADVHPRRFHHPLHLESLVSAICVSGNYIGNCTFEITICVTVVLKVLAEVDIMVPTYGFCQIPPCEEFAENVCDEFFSLPLFPQSSCAFEEVGPCGSAASTASAATSAQNYACGTTSPVSGCCTCSNGGTTCASGRSKLCPRCGCARTSVT